MAWKFYGYPPNWEDIAHQIRARDGFQCTRCGTSEPPLHVHHINGRSHDSSNLTTLCKFCHSLQHPHMKVDYEPDLPPRQDVGFSKRIDKFLATVNANVKKKYAPQLNELKKEKTILSNKYQLEDDRLKSSRYAIADANQQIGSIPLIYGIIAVIIIILNLFYYYDIVLFTSLILLTIIGILCFRQTQILKGKRNDYLEDSIHNSQQVSETSKSLEKIEGKLSVVMNQIKIETKERKVQYKENEIMRLGQGESSRFCPKCKSLMFNVSWSKIEGYELLKCKRCGAEKEILK